MTYEIGRIHGPEEETEPRLVRRVAEHLEVLQGVLSDVSDFIHSGSNANLICDHFGELCFNLRRLLEIRKDQPIARGIQVGFINGSKSENVWKVLSSGCHIQSVHRLTGDESNLLATAMVVLHTDNKSFGIYPKEFFDCCEKILSDEMRPHYGMFPEALNKFRDEDGRPTFKTVSGSRRGAELQNGFYWTSLDIMAPGDPNLAEAKDPCWLIQKNPSLQRDPIFLEAFSIGMVSSLATPPPSTPK